MKAEPLSHEEESDLRAHCRDIGMSPSHDIARLIATLDREQQRAATAEGIAFAYQEKATDACVEVRDQHSFNSKSYNVADCCADAVWAACRGAVAPLPGPVPKPKRTRPKRKKAP